MQQTITLDDGTSVQVADFEFGFTLDGKAELVEPDGDTGPLIIEGYASDFGLDRQDEAFEPNAFTDGLKAYLNNPVLLYHHKPDLALGKILDSRLDTKGLWVRAEVDRPEPGTQEMNYFNKIKSGVIRGFSVGGKFYRRMTAAGPRIFKCDLREISITPMPVNQRMLFAVAGKAFDNMDTTDTNHVITEPDQSQVDSLLASLDALDRTFDALEGKSSQHPDGPAIAALQYHLQHVHTLATDMKQDGQSDEAKSLGNHAAASIKKHLTELHHVAAKIGPLPTYYGGTHL